MRVNLKWFLTGNVTPLEERDELLGPQTTMLEVKGLIQLKYTYPAKNMLVIVNRALRENEDTLRSVGIVDQASADASEHFLTVHVLSGAELEGASGDDDEEETGSSIHEFSHEDFIKASRMLGRDLPVSKQRAAEVRANAPRARPAFVDAKPAPAPAASAPSDQPPTRTTGHEFSTEPVALGSLPPMEVAAPARAASSSSNDSQVRRILTNVWYGLRREHLEKEWALTYPGVTDTFDFWDLRLNMERHAVPEGHICVELFYFGDIKAVENSKFQAIAVEAMQRRGFRVTPIGRIREAGCMYPLIAMPIVMPEAEAMQLGDAVFERWGQKPQAKDDAPTGPPQRAGDGSSAGPAGQPQKPGDCVVA